MECGCLVIDDIDGVVLLSAVEAYLQIVLAIDTGQNVIQLMIGDQHSLLVLVILHDADIVALAIYEVVESLDDLELGVQSLGLVPLVALLVDYEGVLLDLQQVHRLLLLLLLLLEELEEVLLLLGLLLLLPLQLFLLLLHQVLLVYYPPVVPVQFVLGLQFGQVLFGRLGRPLQGQSVLVRTSQLFPLALDFILDVRYLVFLLLLLLVEFLDSLNDLEYLELRVEVDHAIVSHDY